MVRNIIAYLPIGNYDEAQFAIPLNMVENMYLLKRRYSSGSHVVDAPINYSVPGVPFHPGSLEFFKVCRCPPPVVCNHSDPAPCRCPDPVVCNHSDPAPCNLSCPVCNASGSGTAPEQGTCAAPAPNATGNATIAAEPAPNATGNATIAAAAQDESPRWNDSDFIGQRFYDAYTMKPEPVAQEQETGGNETHSTPPQAPPTPESAPPTPWYGSPYAALFIAVVLCWVSVHNIMMRWMYIQSDFMLEPSHKLKARKKNEIADLWYIIHEADD
jgi:hypothetical protein